MNPPPCPATAVRGSCAVVGPHEHRSRVQWAAGLTALSRCAIPHRGVTTERVAKSHNIIRSSRLAVHVATSACAKRWSGPPIVPLLFVESERSCLQFGRTPNVSEIAQHLGVDRELVIEATIAGGNYSTRSTDLHVGTDDQFEAIGETLRRCRSRAGSGARR